MMAALHCLSRIVLGLIMNSSDAREFLDSVGRAVLPIVTVYDSPADYPGMYVARLWDIDRPTDCVIVSGSLSGIQGVIRLILPQMSFIPRSTDDPCIVGSYL